MPLFASLFGDDDTPVWRFVFLNCIASRFLRNQFSAVQFNSTTASNSDGIKLHWCFVTKGYVQSVNFNSFSS